MPNTSYDVTLFGGLAVVLACLFQGKLNTLMVLSAGVCGVQDKQLKRVSGCGGNASTSSDS